MKKILILLIVSVLITNCKNNKVGYRSVSEIKKEFLVKNRFDLNSKNFNFPQKEFNVIGFGAYHSSSKTEETELKLLNIIYQK